MMKIMNRNQDILNQEQTAPCRILGDGVYQSVDPAITSGNGNILIVGSAGTGKSYRFFTPNILCEQASMVVHDPFGNYYEDCKAALEANGFAVESFIADPEDLDRHPDWGRLRKEKLALFVKSSSMAECAREMEVLFSGMVKEFLAEKETPQTPVTVYLDELANCGPIRDFARFMSLSKIYNISCIISVQTLRQIEYWFHSSRDTIVSNCHTVLFYGTPDEGDCHYFSLFAGNQGKDSVPVMEQGDIAKMSPEDCLIFVSGESPLLAKKYNFGRMIWEQKERIRDLGKRK